MKISRLIFLLGFCITFTSDIAADPSQKSQISNKNVSRDFLSFFIHWYDQAELPKELIPNGFQGIEHVPQPQIPQAQPLDSEEPKVFTLVVFNGSTSEYYRYRFLPSLFGNDPAESNIAQEFIKKAARQDSNINKDWHFSLKEMDHIEAPITQLLKVRQIEVTNGHILRIIDIEGPRGSLESIAPFDQRKELIVRRLQKYFKIMGTPKHLGFLGFSHGGLIQIKLAEYVISNKIEGFENLEALVSWAGACWGVEHLRNQGIHGSIGTAIFGLFRQLSQLSTERKDIHANLKLVANIARDLINTFRNDLKIEIEAERELIQGSIFDTDFLAYIKELIHDFDIRIKWKPGYELLIRAKSLGETFLAAITELDPVEVERWYSEHTLPSDIKYYSLAVAQPMSNINGPVDARLKHPWFLSKGLTSRLLRVAHNELYYRYQVPYSDGFITTQSMNFSWEKHKKLNPRQEAYENIALGTVIGHHGTVIAPEILKTIDPSESPMPRRELFLSLASMLLSRQDK